MIEKEDTIGFTPTKGVIDYDEINRRIGLNNIQTKERPLLTISAWCHNHIRALHKKYKDTEWIAWCKIENLGNGHFIMTDMIHPEQECTSVNVEITDDGMEWIDNYLLKNYPDEMGKWCCVLHSHHHMNAFWSGTDDDARMKLNDGRRLAWAVVTNYSGEEIGYKACVNFYKPYPIEIDADVEYEVEDLYQQDIERGEYIKNRSQEVFVEMAKNDELLKQYAGVLEYLGIDITNELIANSYTINMKIPGQQELGEILETLKEKAQEEALKEVGAPIDSELAQRKEWHEGLEEQLEGAMKEPTPRYQKSRLTDYNWNTRNSYDDTSNTWKDYYKNFFNKGNYPTADKLIQDMAFDQDVKLELNPEGEWIIYNYEREGWQRVGDVIEDIYDNPEEFVLQDDEKKLAS